MLGRFYKFWVGVPRERTSSTDWVDIASSPVTLIFYITRDTVVGDALFITGSFMNWDVTKAHKAVWTGDVWKCTIIGVPCSGTYRWKPFERGSQAEVSWAPCDDQVIQVSPGEQAVIVNFAY